MSLTTFVENEDVRDRFKAQFSKPSLPKGIEIRVPGLSKRYSLVGTAFDYLLRFYLKRSYPHAIERSWEAEEALFSPRSPILKGGVLDAETGKLVEYQDTAESKKVRQLVEEARYQYRNYLSSGILSEELLRSVLWLAQIDPIMRAGYIDPNLGSVHSEDVQDLKSLISIVKPETFKAKAIVLLNPTFGKASRLMRGADADVLTDDLLLDVKTTLKLDLQANVFNQLLGYYVLSQIDAIGEIQPRIQISRLGIYYSRYGYLFAFNIEDVTDISTISSFIDWFKGRAEEELERMKGGKR